MTIPRSSDGYGFKLTGGNAVGLFVSDVAAGRDEIKVGDQVSHSNTSLFHCCVVLCAVYTFLCLYGSCFNLLPDPL